MLFFFLGGRWNFDPYGLHNLAWVQSDAHGMYLMAFGYRVPVALVAPD